MGGWARVGWLTELGLKRRTPTKHIMHIVELDLKRGNPLIGQ